jgi:hypothetical protein
MAYRIAFEGGGFFADVLKVGPMVVRKQTTKTPDTKS